MSTPESNVKKVRTEIDLKHVHAVNLYEHEHVSRRGIRIFNQDRGNQAIARRRPLPDHRADKRADGRPIG